MAVVEEFFGDFENLDKNKNQKRVEEKSNRETKTNDSRSI
jgi:hypothetical protein